MTDSGLNVIDSHAYIISSHSPEARRETALELAAARLCESDAARKPCRICSDCRKIFRGIHPDVITVGREPDDKGKLRRDIVVSQIRAMTADAYVMPNEAERKAYIIDCADALNTSAQNAALKLIEEPPEHCVFILCADNPDSLLPTLRSRCVSVNRNDSTEFTADTTAAMEYLRLCASDDRAGILEFCLRCESMDSEQTADFVSSAQYLLTEILCGRLDTAISPERAAGLMRLMSRTEDYLRQNVGIKHIWGVFSARGASV